MRTHNKDVVISVLGGVVDVIFVDAGVRVVLLEHDNHEIITVHSDLIQTRVVDLTEEDEDGG